jgi:type IV secretory pathway VirD2 relaxase
VAFKSEDLKGKTPCVFDANSDHADARAFMNRLNDRVSRHPTAAKAYHCLFSLKRQDFDVLGVPDWREIVREVLQQYERETKRKLDWIASHHDNPERPHCHVVIKAVCDTGSGAHKRLRLDRPEVDRIKEILRKSLEERGLTPDRHWQPDRSRESAYQMAGAVGSALSWLEGQIAAERRRHTREEDERLRRRLKELEREQERDDR